MTDANDPSLKSFIPVDAESHFPIQNLPFGVFRPRKGGTARVGSAIGEWVVDLSVLERERLLNASLPPGRFEKLFERSSLNDFATWRKLAALASAFRPRLPRGRQPTPPASGDIGILP